jgi:ATP-dependent DNA helicase DinG
MDAAQVLGPDGLVSRKLGNYELRTEQIAMAAAVQKALADSHHLLVEAGTGVGKSFAYLLPLIDYSLEHKECVVVSTNTISLQEQLITKDIPFLRTVVPDEFTACLVKGRSNFICLRRLALARELQESLFSREEELKELWRIEDWARETGDGTLSDFDRQPMPSVWAHVQSDHDKCGGRKCVHAERKCFFQRARRRMYTSNLLVVNHHILCSDLALHDQDTAFLPEYRVLVLDEGHSIESVASDYFGVHLGSSQVSWFLNGLHNPRTKKGFLAHLFEKKAVQAVERAKRAAKDLFEQVGTWRAERPEENGRIRTPGIFSNELSPALGDLALALDALKGRAQDSDEEIEIASYRGRALDMSAAVNCFTGQTLSGYVYWTEVGGKKQEQVRLECSPISVAADLKRLLFDRVRTVIITSATLTVGEQDPFGFIRTRLGAHDAEELMVGSPFDYDRQMKVFVPRNMPDPNDGENFQRAVVREVERYLTFSRGRAFVLFTSYRLMEAVARDVRPKLRALGIESLVQGEGLPRNRMIERFRNNIGTVLFGTDSFWQGVDVPGEALSNVIITRLPFSVPDDPVVEARLEKIRDEGGDPFMSYSVPEAVIRLKQGVGRLIRTKTDTGIVVILDPRITTRRYGQLFLGSLPTSTIHRDLETEDGS